jgi:hypothetical protein
MDANMLAIMFKAKGKATESIYGVMVAATRVIGNKANSTVRVFLSQNKAARNLESGKMESVSDGSMEKKLMQEFLNYAASYEMLGFFNCEYHFAESLKNKDKVSR